MSDKLVSLNAVINVAMQYCPDDDGSCSKADVDLREMLDELENLSPTAPHEMSARESIVRFIHAFQRMCEHIQCCPKCPLYGLVCGKFGSTISDIDKAVIIIEKWTQEYNNE